MIAPVAGRQSFYMQLIELRHLVNQERVERLRAERLEQQRANAERRLEAEKARAEEPRRTQEAPAPAPSARQTAPWSGPSIVWSLGQVEATPRASAEQLYARSARRTAH